MAGRYYKQLPFLLHLPSQLTLLWLLGITVYSWVTGETPKELAPWAPLIGAGGIPAGVVLTQLGIRLKYRLRRRSGFGTETGYSISRAGITIMETGQGATEFPDDASGITADAVKKLPSISREQMSQLLKLLLDAQPSTQPQNSRRWSSVIVSDGHFRRRSPPVLSHTAAG